MNLQRSLRNLRRLRQRDRLRLTDVDRALGCSEAGRGYYTSLLESGLWPRRPGDVAALAALFKVDPSELFADEGDQR